MISDITFRVREKSMRTCNEQILRAIAVARKTIYQDKCRCLVKKRRGLISLLLLPGIAGLKYSQAVIQLFGVFGIQVCVKGYCSILSIYLLSIIPYRLATPVY